MEIQISVAKTNKHDSIESGDTLEFVERPNGGISVVIVDAQTSGPLAKSISSTVVRKAINLLAEGVRDGAAARAASDYLYTERNGKVSAYMNIISVDLQTCTLVISRNNPTPVYIAQGDKIEHLSGESTPIGSSRNIRPAISEISLESGITIVTFTDGLLHAGSYYGQNFDIQTRLEAMLQEQNPSAQSIADTILSEAIKLDQCRPNDDMSLLVLRVLSNESDHIRRMNISLPVKFHKSNFNP
ncbi:MAG: serine/threonine-protein phosphatase [Anaerolineaceae bacterium]|nr:serine/threonine-protein phosphatase [Anaerolineaceae bacterium]